MYVCMYSTASSNPIGLDNRCNVYEYQIGIDDLWNQKLSNEGIYIEPRDYGDCDCEELLECRVDRASDVRFYDPPPDKQIVQSLAVLQSGYYMPSEPDEVPEDLRRSFQKMLLQINACDEFRIDRVRICFDNCTQYTDQTFVYFAPPITTGPMQWGEPIFDSNLYESPLINGGKVCFSFDVDIDAGTSKIIELDFFGNQFNYDHLVNNEWNYFDHCNLSISLYSRNESVLEEICTTERTFFNDRPYVLGVPMIRNKVGIYFDNSDIRIKSLDFDVNSMVFVEIFDYNGKIIHIAELRYDKYGINLSNIGLVPGTYICHFTNCEKGISQKIIIR